MNRCRWDKQAERHLLRSHLPACKDRDCRGCEPCLRDDNGDPVTHCAARHGCNGHLGWGERTCTECVLRVRRTIASIVDLAAIAIVDEALEAGVESEAAYLAGPAADPEAWSWRKVTARQGGVWHASLDEEDDDRHPYTVLTRWEFMIREDYQTPRAGATSISSAAAYLTRLLPRIANDEAQDWPLLAAELNASRTHLEAVVHDSRRPEQGAPCPECSTEDKRGPRLIKRYVDHDKTGASDWWGCPLEETHWWVDSDYRMRVDAAYLTNSTRLTGPQIAETFGIPAGSVRSWAAQGRVDKRGKDHEGRQLYDVNQARRCAGHEVTV